GPAGMFAALELIDYGIKPIIFERGKKIEERSLDIQRFIKERLLDTESNIQFGEGGAGSYSDGKLFSRIKNSQYTNKVLDTFIKFGAPEEIAYIRKPHLGTDVLCRIVRNIRCHILERGGEIYYSSKLTDILISGDKVSGVIINGEKEYRSSSIFLAVGHSARDTFEMLHKKGVVIEQKPIAAGVRIEHPAEIINLLRYGDKYKDYPGIGAATYSLTYNDRKIGRGVYTFCMCPGGEVVNASSENGMLVINGMSYSDRSSAFSNAALVVTCHTDDYKSTDPLAGVEFQKDIERKAFHAGGGRWEVPAQNLVDFLRGRTSASLNRNSCKTGTAAVQMNELFPEFINEALVAALNTWKKDYPLFVSDHAILLGAETRTSAPLRIKRNKRYESVNVKNLYPIGEGSGYTGGITSSAADAIKAVEACLSGSDRAQGCQGL
ncbi:MAG: dehydrogenase, partial [Nitrospirota bacterium]|nr:dehydrogenase [Nitrospirota bacterium]